LQSPVSLKRNEAEQDAENLGKDVGCQGEIVVARALWDHPKPQLSTLWPQHTQSKAVNLNQFHLASTSHQIRFGTKGSEVKFLSHRPFFSHNPKDFGGFLRLVFSSIYGFVGTLHPTGRFETGQSFPH
jgi:hypothetical protein